MTTWLPTATEIEIGAALCIGLSGVPGWLGRRTGRAGQRIATALNLLGSAAGFAGLALLLRESGTQVLHFGDLPVGRVTFALDNLSALFLVPILLVSALGSVYGSSYWSPKEHPDNGRGLRLWWGILTAAMMGVVLARDAILFLIVWELMALAAYFLICTEEERDEVRQASWIYLVATHAGSLCLLGFFALLGRVQGHTALWVPWESNTPSSFTTALFALGIAGFGLKAGLMPFHVWLPGAHGNAPSHVSALLSGVLLKMGVYGIVRVCGLVPEPPLWWGGALLGMGIASGVLGIVYAAAQSDLKRLLAYSSIENIGIATIGIGLASIGRSIGRPDLVVLGLGGTFFHVLNHSLFKPLLFFAVGNVLHATGTPWIPWLGGLARTMPRTFALFVVGAIAICGLPPLNGFVGELLLYLGLLRAAGVNPAGGAMWAVLGAPALAMIGALAVVTFVKVIGIAFGGTSRSPAADHAHDPGAAMLAPMGALAVGCALLGLFPSAALPFVRRAVAAWDPAAEGAAPAFAALAPLGWLPVGGLLLLGVAALLAFALLRRASRQRSVLTWDCGYVRPTPRMQYADSSFSETLVGLFGWAVRRRGTPPELRDPFPAASRFARDAPDYLLDRAVVPGMRAVRRSFSRMRALQRGQVQAYLLYVLAAVVIILVLDP